jgi:flagellar biosynthesis anti-sigma factor FlgM
MMVNLSGLDPGGVSASPVNKSPAAQSTSPSSQDATRQPQAEVSITSTGALLARLQQALSAGSAVDQGRVDAVSKALAAGSYRINGDNIARGLIQTERSLGQLTLAQI